MADETWVEVKAQQSNAWDFALEGDFLGTFESVETNVGPNGSTIYKFKTDKGPRSVWGSKVLNDRLSTLVPGEKVKIILKGKKKGKNGRDYNEYTVLRASEKEQEQPAPTGPMTENVDPEDIPF